VTKLYNEEMYVIASKSIRSLADLNGKKVSVDLPNGGTFVTASIVFERLGLKPNLVYIEQRISMEMLKKGEIDAVIAVGGKPYKSVSAFKDDRDRFPLRSGRLCQAAAGRLSACGADREGLSEPDCGRGARRHHRGPRGGSRPITGRRNTDRYRKLALFVDAFFTKFSDVSRTPPFPSEMEGGLAVGARCRIGSAFRSPING